MLRRPDRSPGHAKRRLATLTLLWLVIITAVGGIASAAVMMARRPPDAEILCARSALAAAATTAIIIDATDRFSQDQRQRLITTVESERDRLPRGGRLILVAVNPDQPWEPVELAAVCQPGTADQANPFFATRSKIEARWQRLYGEPIAQAVRRALERASAERSPIIVTLAAVLARADFDGRVIARRLVVISDLLEHDKTGYSQLRGGDHWGLYQASLLPRTVRLDLKSVEVNIDYLQRGQFAGIQGPRHQAFWLRLLGEAGASKVQFLGLTPAPSGTEPREISVAPSRRR